MNFQVFHVNPGKKLKKKDVNNNLSHFMTVFPSLQLRMGIRMTIEKAGILALQVALTLHDFCFSE